MMIVKIQHDSKVFIVKTDVKDEYVVYAPSPYRSDFCVGTFNRSDEEDRSSWLFLPTLGPHAFSVGELDDIAFLLKSVSLGHYKSDISNDDAV